MRLSAETTTVPFYSATLIFNFFLGTSVASLEKVLCAGKNVGLDIEMQGVIQLVQSKGGNNLVVVFVSPPSLEVLENRLRGRGTECEESIQKRMDTAKIEMEWSQSSPLINHIIVNENIEVAYIQLLDIVTACGAV